MKVLVKVLIEIVGAGQRWQHAGYEAMLSVNATLHRGPRYAVRQADSSLLCPRADV